MSFLLFINFLFLISPWPYFNMCIYFIYIIVRKQRDKSFEFFSILSTVDFSKRLITVWIIRKNLKFIQLVNFGTFSVFFFFLSHRSNMVKHVWAGSFANEHLPFIKMFVREFLQCRTFLRVLYWVLNARSAFYTWVRILYLVRKV